MLRVGMLTSGGDCQGLNAAMRGVAKGLFENLEDVEMFGFIDGYKGLMNKDYRHMESADFSGILTLGGTILGTSRMSFKEMQNPVREGSNQTRLDAMIDTYHELDLSCLVVLGGNGTHKTANLLKENGLNVVSLPKTIDNDLWGTDKTFGFQSAVDIATQVVDGIHTTATSHGRVFIIELMGHKVGWLTLHAGVAGGADIILIPEIPYNIDAIVDALAERAKQKKKFSIIAMAEGAMSEEMAAMSKKERKKAAEKSTFPSVAYELAHQLNEILEQEVRVTVPGHFQRGGTPVPYDRVLATRCGTKAAELIMDGKFGYMVGVKENKMIAVPLEEVAGKLKSVPLDNDVVIAARMTGISFGD